MAPRNAEVPTSVRPDALTRRAGAEPLPGYRLIEPLGRGGFGEVWKCEAPGGLFKAVKFVGADPNGDGLAALERAAIERIKTIRHPFLLSLDRVEDINGTLVLVMELADRSLQSVLFDYQGRGLPGIPRGQVLGLLREAAEALDVINFEHGLQHLDVKPHNLFVVSNHVKVADFGLVHRVTGTDVRKSGDRRCGATPLYAAPETLQGSVSRHGDQYSLAIVYQQLLTGTVPFWSPNPYQLLLQHLTGRPDLSALPPADRPVVGRALSKQPDQRFDSCTDFIQALQQAGDVEPAAAAPSPARESAWSAAATRILPDAAGAAPATLLMAEAPAAKANGAAELLRLPQPTGPTFPGYRFLACVGRTVLGSLWTVQAPDGRERLAHYLLDLGAIDADRLERFEALRHPAVAPRDVLHVPPGAAVIVTDLGLQTLRDRFDHCRAEGHQGVPRLMLLTYLESAAEALDELGRAEQLPHLGINPAHLVVDGDRLLLEDYGLASLLGAGRPAGPLNPRYAAPELSEPGGGPAADQYSLALVYTEMLTGIYPRSKAPGGKSGSHRRPALPEHGSGLYRRPTPPPGRPGGAAAAARVDLDFLPPHDRPVVARALDDDPARRYPSCAAFVRALREATPAPVGTASRLRPVMPVAGLAGGTWADGADAPPVGQILTALIAAAAAGVEVRQEASARYLVHPDGAWECRFPIRLVAGLLPLKLEGFRQQWDARPAAAPPGEHAYEIVTDPRGRGAFWRRKPAGLEVRLRLASGAGSETSQREAAVRVGLFGNHGARGAGLLAANAPRIIQSLRAYLQSATEHRLRERWPFGQRVAVYPLSDRWEVGKVVQAHGRDVSLGGVRLRLPGEPPGEFAYLHFPDAPAAGPFALLGRVVRSQPRDGGWDVGLSFMVDGPPAAP